MSDTAKPVIVIAYANDIERPLPKVAEEAKAIKQLFEQEAGDYLEIVYLDNVSPEELLEALRKHRNHIIVVHFAGHSNSEVLDLGDVDVSGKSLASFLKNQDSIKLVFLNGCRNQDQAKAYLAANIPAVVATSRSVEDTTAMDFARGFYQSLLSQGGETDLNTALGEAKAAIEIITGKDLRDTVINVSEKSIKREINLADHASSETDLAWHLFEGNQAALTWCIKDAIHDPLFGLPPIPKIYQRRPTKPYPGLKPYTRWDVQTFFGRGRDIYSLYSEITKKPDTKIILLYGQVGVGKSSLLEAGLLPRLEYEHKVLYLRDYQEGVVESLHNQLTRMLAEFGETSAELGLKETWLKLEAMAAKPLIVIADQLETCLNSGYSKLVEELKPLFNSDVKPQGKLILAFRKDILIELRDALDKAELTYSPVLLEPLRTEDILEVIRKPAVNDYYCLQFSNEGSPDPNIEVSKTLPEAIAADIADERSPIAPVLQVLLTSMWQEAKAKAVNPSFSYALYKEQKDNGFGMRGFLQERLKNLTNTLPELLNSGLGLDLLMFYVGQYDKPLERRRGDFNADYGDKDQTQLDSFFAKAKNHYLLVDTPDGELENIRSRASLPLHSWLVPAIRQEFETSQSPGQQARAILESRKAEGDRPRLLSAGELETVAAGRAGMRRLSEKEERLVERSQDIVSRRLRNLRMMTICLLGALGAVIGTSILRGITQALVDSKFIGDNIFFDAPIIFILASSLGLGILIVDDHQRHRLFTWQNYLARPMTTNMKTILGGALGFVSAYLLIVLITSIGGTWENTLLRLVRIVPAFFAGLVLTLALQRGLKRSEYWLTPLVIAGLGFFVLQAGWLVLGDTYANPETLQTEGSTQIPLIFKLFKTSSLEIIWSNGFYERASWLEDAVTSDNWLIRHISALDAALLAVALVGGMSLGWRWAFRNLGAIKLREDNGF